MRKDYYEQIFEEFKKYWPFEVKNVVEYIPKNDKAIRLIMNDGRKIDYDIITHGLKPYVDYRANTLSEITDERCREAFANRLSEIMVMKGYSQQTLSEHSGLSKGTVYNYIHGTSTPTLTAMRKLAYTLGCTLNDLTE